MSGLFLLKITLLFGTQIVTMNVGFDNESTKKEIYPAGDNSAAGGYRN